MPNTLNIETVRNAFAGMQPESLIGTWIKIDGIPEKHFVGTVGVHPLSGEPVFATVPETDFQKWLQGGPFQRVPHRIFSHSYPDGRGVLITNSGNVSFRHLNLPVPEWPENDRALFRKYPLCAHIDFPNAGECIIMAAMLFPTPKGKLATSVILCDVKNLSPAGGFPIPLLMLDLAGLAPATHAQDISSGQTDIKLHR